MISELSLIEIALEYVAYGLSVMPVSLKTKRPLGSWKTNQTQIMSVADVPKRFTNTFGQHGIGIVCGGVSSGLMAFDFDNKTGDGERIFSEFVEADVIRPITENYNFPYEKTPSGGYHLWLRCPKIQHNETLAACEIIKEGRTNTQTLIELKGEQGICICAPSKNYITLHGSMSAIPTITVEELETFLSKARSFNKVYRSIYEPMANIGSEMLPGKMYDMNPISADETIKLLIENNFVIVSTSGENINFRCPGQHEGSGATFYGRSHLQVFSTNAAPFEANRGYTPFQIKALLKHGGDFHAAAKELAERGYGSPTPTIVPEERQDSFIEARLDPRDNSKKFHINYDRFIAILIAAGFRLFANEADVRLVRINNNIVEEIYHHDIIEFTCSCITDSERRDFLIKNAERLFPMTKLQCLERLSNDFNRDTATTKWRYYTNVAIMVTKDGYDYFDYADLPKPVWRKKILNREFDPQYIGTQNSEIERFVRNIADGSERKFQEVKTVIGYLHHEHKEESCAKGIIFNDKKIPETDDDANGGTGKSILAKYICSYGVAAIIAGREADFGSQFIFQGVSYDTNIILFDDVNRKFPFQNLFSVITGPLKVEKKNKHPFIIAFEHAPKFLITTNYSIHGTGNSYDRRKHEIEFAPYYSESWTPREEFGHDLMSEWTKEEQGRADAFELECARFYLEVGLISNISGLANLRIKQSISEITRDMFDFLMDEIEAGDIKHGEEFDRYKLFEKYVIAIKGDSSEKFQSFTKRLNKFAMICNLKIKSRRSNGINFTRLSGNLDKILKEFHQQTNDGGDDNPVNLGPIINPQSDEAR